MSKKYETIADFDNEIARLKKRKSEMLKQQKEKKDKRDTHEKIVIGGELIKLIDDIMVQYYLDSHDDRTAEEVKPIVRFLSQDDDWQKNTVQIIINKLKQQQETGYLFSQTDLPGTELENETEPEPLAQEPIKKREDE